MTAETTALVVPVLIQLVIALLIVRRSYLMSQGVEFSLARLVLVPVLLFFLWGVTELESTLLTPWAFPYLIVLDAAILVGTTVAFARTAERLTKVVEVRPGVWNFQIAFSVTGLFLVAFLARLALEVFLFPQSLTFSALPNGYPGTEQQVVVVLIDAIFSLSVGLLTGRSIGIHRSWVRSGPGSRPAVR